MLIHKCTTSLPGVCIGRKEAELGYKWLWTILLVLDAKSGFFASAPSILNFTPAFKAFNITCCSLPVTTMSFLNSAYTCYLWRITKMSSDGIDMDIKAPLIALNKMKLKKIFFSNGTSVLLLAVMMSPETKDETPSQQNENSVWLNASPRIHILSLTALCSNYTFSFVRIPNYILRRGIAYFKSLSPEVYTDTLLFHSFNSLDIFSTILIFSFVCLSMHIPPCHINQ